MPVGAEGIGECWVGRAGGEDVDVVLEFGFGEIECMIVASEEIGIFVQLNVEVGFAGMQEVALVDELY